MKNFILISLSFSLLLMSNCTKENDQSKIILKTSGFADSTIMYLYSPEQEAMVDSGYVTGNNLVLNFKTKKPVRLIIQPVIRNREDMNNMVVFWKGNNKVTISGENGNLKNARIAGSEVQLQQDELEARKSALEFKMDSLRKEFMSLPVNETEKKAALGNEARNIENAIQNIEITYIKNNPGKLYSVYTLSNLMRRIPKEQTKNLYETLTKENQSNRYGEIVKKYLELKKDLKKGDEAVDFKLRDLNGKKIRLSDYKGKYVLLYFWSSLNRPCLMDSPELLSLYKKYKDKGLEIIGVSLDKNKTNWENAVKDNNIVWTTVSDLKGFGGDVPLTYDIYFIPTYFLINPDGKIIDKIQGWGKVGKEVDDIFRK